MTSMERLQAVFRQTLDDPELILYAEMTAGDHPGWNSFNHMLLISAIEKEFSLRFGFEEVRDFKKVGDIVRCIQLKKKGD